MLTPPTITADSTNNDLANNIELTFVSDLSWQSAISDVTINGDSCEENSFKIESGKITIQWRNFERAMTYTIAVEATGYDDATVSQIIKVASWNDLTFFEVNESDVFPISRDDISDYDKYYTNQDYKTTIHKTVKRLVSGEIRKYWDSWEREIRDRTKNDSFNCLNYIKNPRILKELMIYKAIYLLCGYQVQGNEEIYFMNQKTYDKKFQNEFSRTLPLLEFDEPVTQYESREIKAIRIVR